MTCTMSCILVRMSTSARCEGGEGVEGEVVKVTRGDQSLCPASLIACGPIQCHVVSLLYSGIGMVTQTLILALCRVSAVR